MRRYWIDSYHQVQAQLDGPEGLAQLCEESVDVARQFRDAARAAAGSEGCRAGAGAMTALHD